MTILTLPALDGRTPLGFLAALGLTRLLDVYTDDVPRLAWSPVDYTAQLHTTRASIDAVVTDLRTIVDSIPNDGVLPGVPVNLPPPGAAPDQLRLPPVALRALVNELAPEPNAEVEAWLGSLVTDLSLDDKSRCDISMMAAPSGKQSMRTMLYFPLKLVREDPGCLAEALVGWRRRPGVSGEYLDHRVLFDGADSGVGRSEERGVPGATWLALMSYPLLRTTVLGSEPITTGWHRQRRQPALFVYPLWTAPLDRYAVTALLEHPLMQQSVGGELPAAAAALSIFMVRRAHRRKIPGRTFAGVLGTVS
ncbi:MAG: type I-G CRISPR-associated protein, Cas3-extension family [Dermatophilaceae bacterium]